MSNKFTQKAQNTLNRSLSFARELGHSYVGSEHLLWGLISEKESIASRLLVSGGADAERLKKNIVEISGSGSPGCVPASDMTPKLQKIIENSASESQKSGARYIGTEHLLMALLQERSCMACRFLESDGILTEELKQNVSAFLNLNGDGTPKNTHAPEKEEKFKIRGAPTLSLYGRDLTEWARSGKIDPIIGRDAETERVICILSRRTKNNPCLIGDPGVGKTAVVEGLAERIAERNVPDSLANRRIVTLDLSSMIAGAKYRGEFEERMKTVMEEVRRNPDILLFIDEIHVIIGAGAAEGAVDAANILKPALARGEIQIIGATTLSEYRSHIEKDAALERRFQSVLVGEPTAEEAKIILRGLRPKYESHHGLRIEEDAVEAAVRLSVRYLPDRFLPDKAIDLMDEAAANVRIESQTPAHSLQWLENELKQYSRQKEQAIVSQNFERAAELRDCETKAKSELEQRQSTACQTLRRPPVVRSRDIADVITRRTGIPVSRLLEEEERKLLSLETELKKQIIGQDEAIDKIAGAIRRGRTGFKDPKRPIGSFFFLGKSGVGKTETARALATELFGDASALIRLDMSEYMEKHSASALIGSPPGYVGYEEGGQLTEKIRRRPYSVVLFDEMEKAHPDVLNLLLQILEDGRLTDSRGKTADFSNTVIIMTSNVGSRSAASHPILGFSEQGAEKGSLPDGQILASLRQTFREEFLNRIDEILIFHPLGTVHLEKIAQNMLSELGKRSEEAGVSLRFDPSVARFLVGASDTASGGARPLRRTIVHAVEDPLSVAFLERRFVCGDTVFVSVHAGSSEISFEKLSESA